MLIINELRWHLEKKLQHLMLNYDFYSYDNGSKIKNLRAGAGLLQRYEMGVGWQIKVWADAINLRH